MFLFLVCGNSLCFLFFNHPFWFTGIDGPAAVLKPEIQELEAKLQIISVGSSATEDDPELEKAEETVVDVASKRDLQDILQKRGANWMTESGLRGVSVKRSKKYEYYN